VVSDLIFVFNLRESTQQYCLIETFEGQIKALKKRTYSGPIKPIDLLQLDFADNISVSLLRNIKDLFLNESRQTKKNRYLFSLTPFIKAFSMLTGVKGVYCICKDRSLNELDGILEADINYKREKDYSNPLYLKAAGSGIIHLDKKSFCSNICGKILIYANNNLYLINRCVDYSLLKKHLELNRRGLSETDIASVSNKISTLSKKIIETRGISPVPVLYVTFSELSTSGKLFFSYSGVEVPSNSNEEKLQDNQNGVVYLRSLVEEKQIFEYMISAGWKHISGNNFVLQNNSAADISITELIQKQFEVLTFDRKKILPSNNADYNISSGLDWFELNATTSDSDAKRNLTHLINLKSRKRYIELDNDILLLPDLIWEYRDIFKQHGNQINATKNHIGQILDIIDSVNVQSTFRPNILTDFESTDLIIPSTLEGVLRPYQWDGVRWLMFLYKNNLGGCLADDMGLGKTIQAITFISSLSLSSKQPIRLLIVIPKTLIQNWIAEFRKFGEGINVNVYHGASRDSSLLEFEYNGGVLLTTYNTLLNDLDIISAYSFDCMFLDEAQNIKNYRAKTYQAAVKIVAKSKFILSGTPFENNISELWALMELINPGCLGNRAAFIKKFGDITENNDNLKRLNTIIKPFVLRRMKKDVLKELPDKTELTLMCDMEDAQLELYDSVLKSIKYEIERMPDRFEIKDASIILEGLLYLRQICCHPSLLKNSLNWNHCVESGKFELFKLKVDELQTNGEKVVVFSQFTTMLDILKKWADKHDYSTFYLDGTTTHRQEVVDSFENSDKGIFFISLKAGGVGLNIVSCQYAIIYDPWWNPAVENQAADRIYRIGQTKNVFIYHLITANSIEEKVEELKKGKRMISENLLIDTEHPDKLSFDTLKDLILK
jgi:SNF2 family DNA or RNA helicase